MFQSPKTGLCYFHMVKQAVSMAEEMGCFNPLKRVFAIFTCRKINGEIEMSVTVFQSPKTGLCYFHNSGRIPNSSKIKLFQSPKTGLCYFHPEATDSEK